MISRNASLLRAVREFAFRSSYGSEPGYAEVKAAGAAAVQLFLQEYPSARSWKQRASFVYHSIPHARTCRAAVALASLALSDRSRHVKYRACMLLACAQDPTTLDLLREQPGRSKTQKHKGISERPSMRSRMATTTSLSTASILEWLRSGFHRMTPKATLKNHRF